MHPTTYLLGALSKRELAVLSNDGESIFFPDQKTIGTGQLQSFTNVYNAM